MTIKDEFDKWFDAVYPVTSAYGHRPSYQHTPVKELMLAAYQAGQESGPQYLHIGKYEISPTADGIHITIMGSGEGMLTPRSKFKKLIGNYFRDEF